MIANHPDSKYTRWWDAKKRGDAHRTVSGLVETLKRRQHAKRKLDIHHAKIYGNFDVPGSGLSTATAYELLRGDDGRMRYQLCTAAVDTAQSILTSNKPVPYYLTDGAEWGEQRKAKRKSKIIAGQFMDLDIHAIAQRCARDALVYGTGILYAYVDADGKVCAEQTKQCEWLVDSAEAASGSIRSLFRNRMIAKEQLADLYHRKAGQIQGSSGPSQQDWDDRHLAQDSTLEMVMVYEAYHLPSKADKSDGRRIVCTDQCVLVDEAWEHDWFPIASMRWKDRLTGWWGVGVVEETKAAQLRINKLIKIVERQQTLGSNSWVFVPKDSGIQEHEITNAPMQVVPYNSAGGQPYFYQHSGTPVDLRNEISYIRDETFQQLGLNQSQVQGEKPKGINSAVGMRTAEDIGSRRHLDNVRQYERFFVEIARLLENMNDVAAKRAKAAGKTYMITSIETRGRAEVMRSVAWEDVQTKSPTTTRMFPVSALGSTPAGKMESIQELVGGGYLSRQYAVKLLDFPDLDAAMALELVDLDVIQWQLERIQDGEKNVTPLPIMNLEMAFEEARKVRLQCELLEASEDVKREVQRYRDNVATLIKLGTPKPPPEPMMPPQDAMAAPQMAPGLAA